MKTFVISSDKAKKEIINSQKAKGRNEHSTLRFFCVCNNMARTRPPQMSNGISTKGLGQKSKPKSLGTKVWGQNHR